MKSLYGLKQVNDQRYANLTSSLHNLDFVQSPSDHSLFTKKTDTSFIVFLIYVDDIILAKDNISHMDEVKNFLNENFKIKDLAQINFFLGLDVV